MGQLDLRSQLYIRNFRFLWHAFRSDNNIRYTCINNALCNSNSGLGYKLAFYRYMYSITMADDFELCIIAGDWVGYPIYYCKTQSLCGSFTMHDPNLWAQLNYASTQTQWGWVH